MKGKKNYGYFQFKGIDHKATIKCKPTNEIRAYERGGKGGQ